jgi:enterochelin esterase-like enzyme
MRIIKTCGHRFARGATSPGSCGQLLAKEPPQCSRRSQSGRAPAATIALAPDLPWGTQVNQKLVLLASAFLIMTSGAWSQQSSPATESPMLAGLKRDLAAGKPSAVAEFWKAVEQQRTPIVERIPGDQQHVLATFLWKDNGDTRDVVLDLRANGIEPFSDQRSHLRRLPGTNIWYLTHTLPSDAEVLYQFSVNPPDNAQSQVQVLRQTMRPDPLNPNQYPDKNDPFSDPSQPWRTGSIARMPGVTENPWLTQKVDVAKGAFQKETVKSAFLEMANPRNIWVYMSPGAPLLNPNVLILFDGNSTYQSRVPTAVILDNLYAAKKISQTVAIFVDNGGPARNVDMNFSDAFVKFLTDELLPQVQREYKFKADPARTALGGDSLCGTIAAYAALQRPDVFGEVLAQSGAFQFNNRHDVDNEEPEWLARQFAAKARSNVFFYLDVGQMEDRPGEGTSLLAANRHLRDILRAKGYRVQYSEVYSDHDPVHWRRTLPDALTAILGQSR